MIIGLKNLKYKNMNTEIIDQSQLTSFLNSLIASKKLPVHIKTVEDAFTVQQMGKELGFSTMQSFHYIVPIQGKLSLSSKAVGGLLRRGRVEFITKEDGVYVYKDGSTSEYVTENKPVDRRTSILFYRGGKEELVSFTWKDAELQGLTAKDNWKRMPKEMLWARCLAKGANRIGNDLLLGLYTTEELSDTFGVNEKNIQRSEDGTIEIITEK